MSSFGVTRNLSVCLLLFSVRKEDNSLDFVVLLVRNLIPYELPTVYMIYIRGGITVLKTNLSEC